MISDALRAALATIGEATTGRARMQAALRAYLLQPSQQDQALPSELRASAQTLAREGVAATRTLEGQVALAGLLTSPEGEGVLAFCQASTWVRDASFAPILTAAARVPDHEARARSIARARVVEGPLLDALGCAPLLGSGADLGDGENAEARARLDILLWEAGARALEVPALGPWIWGSRDTFEALIVAPAHGALRGRVLAARCIEVAVGGLTSAALPELVSKTLQVLQPLLLHPEPLVWVHAARALGRLTGVLVELEGTLLDWVFGSSPVLRQRSLTAFASLPSDRLAFLSSQLVTLIEAKDDEQVATLSAVAAATPYLFASRPKLWDRAVRRILNGDGRAIAARALARGLVPLFRRGAVDPAVMSALQDLRQRARFARPTDLDETRRWIEVIALTDVIDGAERDPWDLELGLENLTRLAAEYDDEEADARAVRFADALGPTFLEARKVALGEGARPPTPRHRAAALNALESSARAFALRLWSPIIATRPTEGPAAEADFVEEPNLDETWKMLARTPAEILTQIATRKQAGETAPSDEALEVLAIRLGGYALDACGNEAERGPTAHDTCLWLRKVDGLVDGSRELGDAQKRALSALLWRLVDTTRGTALGEVDDARWIGPFAAWWALVIDRPAVLLQLATALPMVRQGALTSACTHADKLRAAISSAQEDAGWSFTAAEAFQELSADDTELAHALNDLAEILEGFDDVSGLLPDLDARCLALVLAGERLQGALADPVKALRGAHPTADAALSLKAAANAPRIAALVSRAVRTRDLSMLDVWLASLGPVASGLLEAAIRGAIRRTPPPPPTTKKQPKIVEGYELVKPLGEGGVGTVWLVRKPGADRLFVLKIPKADALAQATPVEREGILASFVEEAKALAGLYHPNVANIIDRGVSDDMPFLVLEYLIGADLKQYASARPMSLFELRQVVIDTCAGLAGLHGAGLVHRDIKPANLWLRLPLAGGDRFDPAKHRDPAHTQPLATVVIDFGMVRATRVPADAAGRFVAGTPGYIAPEQVLDPVELDPRADVYALAGTIYNVTTGRAFFDDLNEMRDRVVAHMRQDPFEDAERLRGFPSGIAKLLRAAVARDAAARPSPLEFGREFASAL